MKNYPQHAICVITRKPNMAWFDFLSGFKHYDTYVVIDDNSENYAEKYKAQYPTIKIIQMGDVQCENKGYININSILFKKKVTAWEKALLYFTERNQEYNNIWFFEDDVFFYNEKTIKNIDTRFKNSDLLSAPYKVNTKTSKTWFWWPKIKIEFAPPYYNAMVCGVRVSRKLLLKISEYAAKYNTLFFLEVLFPTIALKNNLRYDMPKEMTQVYFRHKWNILTFSKNNIFHPVKNIELHTKARKVLTEMGGLIDFTFHVANFFTRVYLNGKSKVKVLIGR